VSHYILPPFVDGFVFQMKAVVLAEMLRDTLEAKINKTRREIRDNTYMPIEADRLQAQIMAYQWVQARIKDLVTSNDNIKSEIRDTRTRI
jgi:hypothetical protein